MTMNDPMLEVLREIRGDLGRVTTELGRLVRHAEYTNARLDEHGAHLESLDRHAAATVSQLDQHGEILREHGGILREHGEILRDHGHLLRRHDTRLESLDRHAVATVAALDLLHAGVRTILPALEQGRLRDEQLLARMDACERRIDVLEQR
jgi:hypothetical protein